ncbi:MAG: DUF4349 domain-containing protein, partial [Lachnospiraceae bacterium]|nr:DUF4349 domain-containing protein [Lachnospiraceae bacterium]
MKKSTRNVLIVVIIILFILCLISFNVNGIKRLFNKTNMRYMYSTEEVEEDAVYDYAVAETRSAMSNKKMAQTFAGSMAVNTAEAPMAADNGAGDIERKLIKNIYLECETQDFDGTYDLVKRKVVQYDGVVDSE